MSEPVLYSAAGGVAEIRFNRPDRLNALDAEMALGLVAGIGRALADPGVRVVLFSGEGRSFMAGGDLRAMSQAANPAEVIAALVEPIHDALLRLSRSPAITIAAAQGPVAGGGMSLFLAADLGLMADDASLTTAYARLGGSPDLGGSASLAQMVGLRKAMELLLLSDPVPAAEALRLGLANRVVPAAALMDEARALAGRLAAGPPLALGRCKALLRSAFTRDLAEQLRDEAASFVALAATEDFREGLDAFFERRPARFSGK